MKRFIEVLCLALLVSLSSCREDESPSLTGEIHFDGNIYHVTNNITLKLASDELESIYAVNFSDGLWTEDKEGDKPIGETSFRLSFVLRSTTIDEISTGLYESESWEPQPWNEGNIFFGVYLDEFETDKETYLEEGTLNISGDLPHLTFEFDVMTTEGKKLTGSVSGSLRIEQITGQ